MSDLVGEPVKGAVLVLSESGKATRLLRPSPSASKHILFATRQGLFLSDVDDQDMQLSMADFLARNDFSITNITEIRATVDMTIENNWPAKKLRVDETEYAVPSNFADSLRELIGYAK